MRFIYEVETIIRTTDGGVDTHTHITNRCVSVSVCVCVFCFLCRRPARFTMNTVNCCDFFLYTYFCFFGELAYR